MELIFWYLEHIEISQNRWDYLFQRVCEHMCRADILTKPTLSQYESVINYLLQEHHIDNIPVDPQFHGADDFIWYCETLIANGIDILVLGTYRNFPKSVGLSISKSLRAYVSGRYSN